MTANYIAQVVENLYNKLDLDKMSAGWDKIKKYNDWGGMTDEWINTRITDKTYIRWCMAIGVLEDYCRKNYDTFEETELVYKWAKNVCDGRTEIYNKWRAYGGYSTFKEYLKKNW
jgi:hypothetical protein